MNAAPRIGLISALAQSPGPAMAAMGEIWPEAWAHNLLDDSLAADYATLGEITPAIIDRFLALGRYAASVSDGTRKPVGILFTCSAFRPAIDRVKADLTIPVVSPNEGAFDEALDICAGVDGGGRIAVLLTFAGSLAPLTGEIEMIARARGQTLPEVVGIVADGALPALQAGDEAGHDRLAAQAAATIGKVDVTVIGQFSMARALPLVTPLRPEPVLTTPQAAVRKLRRLVEAGGGIGGVHAQ
ncbi:arylsulfatase [Novosphingobium sp. FKTRR1]|uniref:arylsulfatase n=1 Tax=Novosphingobium sp. FKTRR1 TaxID=2879118 RepID=UPI001CF05C9B|nr:arylsulfatase [Novosphingobium sp. FKTRR1]